MSKLRLGCVGIGNLGIVHLEYYTKDPRVEVVAICDIIPSKMDDAEVRLGIEGVHKYENFADMIDTENLDIVGIATPNDFHSIVAVCALDHGCHVFCEKPDAINVEEALKMKTAAEKAGKVLMVMRNNRYYGNSVFMKKYIADGNMGEIYCGRCGWIRRRGVPGKGGWFTTKAKSGGGPLIDLGVHMIDLSMWLMGNPTPVAVSGCTFNKFADNSAASDSVHAAFGTKQDGGTFDVEDLAMGFIRFDNGACLQIEFSWASNIERETRFVELRGTKAGCTWHDDGTVDVFGEDEDGNLFDLHPHTNTRINGHHSNVRHFVDVVEKGIEPDFKPIQGLNMIKILRAIYESAETGKEVRL
ncbi:MAG: Gfo/Idh/MocA family oxidoreductase [Clostridia bacterium]|nr:Gfo/Idh/MocA family oxidoreductase [Clostridia bacterium]